MPIRENRTTTVPASLGGAKRGARQYLFLASISFSVIVGSLLILKFAPGPFFWVFLTWAAALFASMFGVHGSWPRAILLNLGIVVILLAGAEAYLTMHAYAPTVVSSGFIVRDDVLMGTCQGYKGSCDRTWPGRTLPRSRRSDFQCNLHDRL